MDSFFIKQALVGLMSLPPVVRRLLLIAIDALLLPFAVWLSYWLRLSDPFHPYFFEAGSWLLLAVLLVGLPLYRWEYKGTLTLEVLFIALQA